MTEGPADDRAHPLDDPGVLRAVLEHTSDFVVVVDPEGVLRYVSPAARGVLGYEPADAVGTSALDVVHPDDRAEMAASIAQSAAAGAGTHPPHTARFRHADGTDRYLEIVCSNRLDDPALRGLVVSVRDVTDRVAGDEARRASDERYHLLFDASRDAVIVVDRDTLQIIEANHAAPSLYRRTREEMLDRLATDLSTDPAATAAAIRDVGNQTTTVRRRHVRSNGSEFDAEITFGSLELDGRALIVAVIRDVTEQARAEAEVRALIEHSSDVITVLDADGTWRFSSEAGTRLLGYQPGFDPPGGIFSLLHPDDVSDAVSALAEVVADTRRPDDVLKSRVRAIDGRWHHFETIATNLVDDPNVRGIVLNSRDITERVRAEEAMRTSEEGYRALVERSSDIVFVLDAVGQLTYANPSLTRLLGHKPEQVLGHSAIEFVHSDDVERVVTEIARVATTPGEHGGLVYRAVHADGSYRTFEAVGQNRLDDPNVAGLVVNARDITQRLEAEEALRATEDRFRALVQHATDLVTVIDADGVLTYVSPSVTSILGYEPTELEGTNAREILHPDDLEHISEVVTAHILDGTQAPALEYRSRHKDGTWRILEGVTTSLLDEPTIRGIVSNSRDVTARRSADRRAAELTEILEASTDFVVLSDPSGRIVYANHAARELLGPGEHDHVSKVSTPGSRERLRVEIMPLVRRRGAWSGELELVGRAGPLPVAATIQAHLDEHGRISRIATIAHDISKIKAAQQRLEYEATHDLLTGLPNRAMFREIGERAIARAGRTGEALAVLFLDLDGFKLVNDGFGHDAGDRLLSQVARRLRGSVRLGDTVARLGGDEFVILCEQPQSEALMLELAERLIAVVSEPFLLDGSDVRVGASIGVAYDAGEEAAIGEMIREADVALYRAKHGGRGRAKVFDRAELDA